MSESAWPMLERCLKANQDPAARVPEDDGEALVGIHGEHPETRDGGFEVYTPNLLIWNGRTHVMGLTLKEDYPG